MRYCRKLWALCGRNLWALVENLVWQPRQRTAWRWIFFLISSSSSAHSHSMASASVTWFPLWLCIILSYSSIAVTTHPCNATILLLLQLPFQTLLISCVKAEREWRRNVVFSHRIWLIPLVYVSPHSKTFVARSVILLQDFMCIQGCNYRLLNHSIYGYLRTGSRSSRVYGNWKG